MVCALPVEELETALSDFTHCFEATLLKKIRDCHDASERGVGAELDISAVNTLLDYKANELCSTLSKVTMEIYETLLAFPVYRNRTSS